MKDVKFKLKKERTVVVDIDVLEYDSITDFALIYIHKNITPYVVVKGLDFDNVCWAYGIYYKGYRQAIYEYLIKTEHIVKGGN